MQRKNSPAVMLEVKGAVGVHRLEYLILVPTARILTASFKNNRQECNTIEKRNSPLPSFLSGGQNRNDDRRKEYNLTLSEESGIG